MFSARLLVCGLGPLVFVVGCQANPSKSSSSTARQKPESPAVAAQPPRSPLSKWKEEQTALAMRGLRYDSGRVERDEPIATEIAPKPDRARALAEMARGIELHETNQKTGALAALTRAALFAPRESEIYIHLGRVLEMKGKVSHALAAFRTALDLAPDSIDARIALAKSLQRSGDGPAAIEMWNDVVERDADNAEAHGRLAILHYYQNDYPTAWLHVHAAEELSESVPPQFRNLLASRSPEPSR